MNLNFKISYLLVVFSLINPETYCASSLEIRSYQIPKKDIVQGNLQAIQQYCKKFVDSPDYDFSKIDFEKSYELQLFKPSDKNDYNDFVLAPTAILLAIEHKKYEIVKFLVENGANPNFAVSGPIDFPYDSLLPVVYAIMKGEPKIINFLLSHPKIKLNAPEILEQACINGLENVINFLLDNKYDVNTIDLNSRTALHRIVQFMYQNETIDFSKIVRLLLARGANVNIQDKLGNTALIIAAKKYNSQIVELLLQHGAIINVENIYRESFISLANESHDLDVIYKKYITHFDNIKNKILLDINCMPNVLINLINDYIHAKQFDYEPLIKEMFSIFDCVLQSQNPTVMQTLILFLNKYPELINLVREDNETMLMQLIVNKRSDIIEELFKNPLILKKPNIRYCDIEQTKMYAQDKQDVAYNDIALYLEQQYEIQEDAISKIRSSAYSFLSKLASKDNPGPKLRPITF